MKADQTNVESQSSEAREAGAVKLDAHALAVLPVPDLLLCFTTFFCTTSHMSLGWISSDAYTFYGLHILLTMQAANASKRLLTPAIGSLPKDLHAQLRLCECLLMPASRLDWIQYYRQ